VAIWGARGESCPLYLPSAAKGRRCFGIALRCIAGVTASGRLFRCIRRLRAKNGDAGMSVRRAGWILLADGCGPSATIRYHDAEQEMTSVYPIFDTSSWVIDRVEQMGSKKKLWLFHPTNGRRWLFKENRQGTGEDWSEKIAAEMAAAMTLPHANVELAIHDGVVGAISQDFISDRHTAQLVHGNELIIELGDAAYPAKRQRYRVSEHTVSRVLAVLQNDFIALPTGTKLPAAIGSAPELFVGYLLLDALIGNTDRHHENWAVIDRRPPEGAKRLAELAPTFDHASCLGRELTDSRREEAFKTKDRNRTVEAYFERMQSAFYLKQEDPKPLHPLQAAMAASREFPRAGEFWAKVIGAITADQIGGIVNAVPTERMSLPARQFCVAMLECTGRTIRKAFGFPS
jgi:hypothetical protein